MSSSVASIAHWQTSIADLLPALSKPQTAVLGLLSYAAILTRSSGLTSLSKWGAQVEQVPCGRMRQRLREFAYEAKAKRGRKRREVKVEECFPDLLRGVLKQWDGPKELVLALDASALGERFVTLNLSVVYRGCGIPVAWSILRANRQEGWKERWIRLLQVVAEVIPTDWKVLAMADRGLYAPWLYWEIQARGWHPFLRVKENLSFRATGEAAFHPIRERLPRRGRRWSGEGAWSETGETITGTLLVCWEKGYEERMAVVTDLPAEEANVAWYQMRFWIEDEYKDHKRGCFHWEHTKMSDPGRAERWYLVMAVAMQMAVRVGGALEAREQQQAQQSQAERGGKRKAGRVGRPARVLRKPRGREQSCLERGCQAISAAAVRGEPVPMGPMVAEPWPSHLYAVGKPPSSWVKKRKHKEVTRRQRKSKQAEARRRERAERKEHYQAEQQARCHPREEKARDKEPKPEKRHAQRQAQRPEAARAPKVRQQGREGRPCVREEHRRAREQQQQERQRWHEEVARDRQRRLVRKQERADRRAQATLASQRSVSQIFGSQEVFVPPAQPP